MSAPSRATRPPNPLGENQGKLATAARQMEECLKLLDECDLSLAAAHLDLALHQLRRDLPALQGSA